MDHHQQRAPRVTITVCDTPICVLIDTGACVNILDPKTCRTLKTATPLKSTAIKLYPYGSQTQLAAKGELFAKVRHKPAEINAWFYVTSSGNTSLLSYNTAKPLGLIKMTLSTVTTPPTHLQTKMVSDVKKM